MKKLIALFVNYLYNINIKEVTMPRKKPDIVDEILGRTPPPENESKPDVKVETKVADQYALGVSRHPTNGRWQLVKVPYNSETLMLGAPERLGEGDHKAVVLERFKIEASKFFGDG